MLFHVPKVQNSSPVLKRREGSIYGADMCLGLSGMFPQTTVASAKGQEWPPMRLMTVTLLYTQTNDTAASKRGFERLPFAWTRDKA